MLADAFSEFISASAQLEASYRDLQTRVAHLSTELADRNADLTRSLAENDRMRAALQQIIDSMPCGVLVLNTAETIVMINPECRRLLNLGSIHVTTLRDLSAASRIDFEGLSEADDRRDAELCVATETGKRWLEVGKRELICLPQKQEPATAPLRSIWILRDITAAKQAELEREAARRATTLAEISSILAHEIRNPLASLELFAGLIAEDSSANPHANLQWIGHLRAGIRTLSGTVNNVLSLNGEGTPQFAELDLIACVRGGVEFVQPIAEQSSVTLAFSAQAAALTIRGNEDGIRQIVLNLIRNAIRHTAAGGSVQVTARAAGNLAIVDVQDTGCGIPAEHLGRLFEAGFSGTGATPGLGLAVCKRLMAQHGGTIRVASRMNEGSNFQLEFPAL